MSPELVVISGFALLAAAGLAAPLAGRLPSLAAAALSLGYVGLAAIYAALIQPGRTVLGFGVFDSFSALLLAGAAVAMMLAVLGGYEVYSRWGWAEAVPAVACLAVLGVLVLAAAGDLVTLYAGWILAAAATYILIALAKDGVSAEAATKYAMLGGVASLVLVAGLGFMFAGSGSMLLRPATEGVFALAAAAMVLASAGFKIGAVPWHGWVPDVYGNARPLLVAMASAAAKAVAVILAVKVLLNAPATPELLALLASLAAVTMTYGNVAAAASDRPQLVLAYSSVAQAGYLVAGLFALTLGGEAARLALTGLALHTLGYILSKPAAFLALDAVAARTWEELKGSWGREPLATAGMALGLASLLGAPPSLGFWGKLYIVLALAPHSPLLAIVMAVNFAIGAYYYARMISALFMGEGGTPVYTLRGLASLALGALTFVLGLVPWLGEVAAALAA